MQTDGARLSFRLPVAGASGRVLDDVRGDEVPLGVGVGRDGLLYVPDTAEPGAPVIVFLHGAGGSGRRELRVVLASADRYGVVVVAPDSRGQTWDIIEGGFGPDVEFIDRALNSVADRLDVDLSRLALGGVSDGASYALSIGLSNGDVFPTVIAYSPGFIVVSDPVATPRVFISHGTKDPILPIEGCGRRIAQGLDHAGYDLSYIEFDGGHTVPPPIADWGFAWWLT